MSKNLRVSVIIPFFNTEKFIETAIKSVFSQTYTSWELILVDDGSTDNSTRIALEYARNYPEKVIYLEHHNHANRGTSASRNLGIRNAKGKYIATLDSDDFWLDYKLEQQVNILESCPCAGMVYGDTKVWFSWDTDSNNDQIDSYFHDSIKSNTLRINSLVNPPRLLIALMQDKCISASSSNMMFRKEVIDLIGGYEESFVRMNDDWAFLSKLYLTVPVFIADSCWDFYRQHPNSLFTLTKRKGQRWSEELYYLDWLGKYVISEGITDSEILNAINKRKRAIQKNEWIQKHSIINALSFSIPNAKSTVKHFIKRSIKSITGYTLPCSFRHFILSRLLGKRYRPLIGWVNFGELRRLSPISQDWGRNRGQAVDCYYVNKFLEANSDNIRGNVLVVGYDDYYANAFREKCLIRADIPDLCVGNYQQSTMCVDSNYFRSKSVEGFDCIVFIQSVDLTYDLPSLIDIFYGYLRPGGALLAAIRGISPTVKDQQDGYGLSRNFTSSSVRKIFEEKLSFGDLEIQGFGNVLVSSSFLYGLSSEDLTSTELDYYDRNYEILTTVKALRPVC